MVCDSSLVCLDVTAKTVPCGHGCAQCWLRQPPDIHSGRTCRSMTDPNMRGLWLAVATLAAALVAVSAALLSWVNGGTTPEAALAGGGAFAASLMLLVTMLRFAADNRD